MIQMKLVKVGDKYINTAHELYESDRFHGSGVITKEYKSLKKTKIMCRGCQNDYYNHRSTPGFDGATECWSFEKAKVCNKVGPSHSRLEYGPNVIKKKTLTCWHG